MEFLRQYDSIVIFLVKISKKTLLEMFSLNTLYTLYQIIYNRTIIDYQCLIKYPLGLNKQRTYLILLLDHLSTIFANNLHLKTPTGHNFVLDIYSCF
jgi:hypothetical protein